MSSGSGGGGTTTTNTTPWSGQQPFLTTGFDQAQNILNSDQPQYYPGSTVAPQSGLTTQAYGMMQGAANNPLQGQASQQVSNTLNGNYLNGNPYLDAQFQAGTRQIGNTYNNLVNGQTAAFSGAGRYGSGMQAFAQNQANQTLGDNLNNLYANTYGQNYTNERANQVNAVGQAAGLEGQAINNANALGTAGSSLDAFNQNLVNADVNKYNYNQNLPQNKLANYMGIIQGNYGGQSATTVPTSGSNTFGQVLGGLGTVASIAGAFSDRRLKEDIKKIGTADNGLAIYSYKYIGQPTTQLGFMADEVEKLHPEAVGEVHGFKTLNYEMAVR